MWKEILDRVRFLWKDFLEFIRKKSPEPRIWVKRWDGKKYFLSEETCPSEFDRLLVHLKQAESRTEAQKFLKTKSVYFRDYYCDTPWIVPGLKDRLPVGWPYWIKVGKSTWSAEAVMIPGWKNQSFWVWEKEII